MRCGPCSSSVFPARHPALGERQSLKRAIAQPKRVPFLFQIDAQTSHRKARTPNFSSNSNCIASRIARLRQAYFSTRMNSPVDALTATVSLAPSRLEP